MLAFFLSFAYLIFCSITNQSFSIVECNIAWCCTISLVVCNDFDFSMLPNAHAGICRSQINSNCFCHYVQLIRNLKEESVHTNNSKTKNCNFTLRKSQKTLISIMERTHFHTESNFFHWNILIWNSNGDFMQKRSSPVRRRRVYTKHRKVFFLWQIFKILSRLS